MTGKAPAFQFFAKDHIATLAMLSLEEAGVWAKLCAHLWEHGGPMPVSLAHRIVPEKALLSVCFLFAFSDESKSSETESSERTMWLPWMEQIRAEMNEKRALRVAAGKVGGRGNVRGSKDKSKTKANAKQNESKRKHSRAEVEDAVEVEDRSIEVEEEKKTRERKSANPKPDRPQMPFASQRFSDAWDGYLAMRTKARKPPTDRAVELVLAKLAAMGEPAAIASLDASTVAGWTDVYPPKAGSQTIAEKSQATIMSRTERPEPLRDFIRRRSAEATASRATETTEPHGA